MDDPRGRVLQESAAISPVFSKSYTLTSRVLLLSRRTAFIEPLLQAFEKAGVTVVCGIDADEAHTLFGDPAHDVPAGAVIDLLSIDDDIEDLCGRLRERKEAESVPILFIGTGQESIRSTTDALIAGGDGFFQLPVEAPRVVAKIAAYLGVPLPALPHGLLVTIDDHDVLERTPEPTRLVVPAMTPDELLGDDDATSAVVDGIGKGDASLSDDFGEATSPWRREDIATVVPAELARGPGSLEGDSIDDDAVALAAERRDTAPGGMLGAGDAGEVTVALPVAGIAPRDDTAALAAAEDEVAALAKDADDADDARGAAADPVVEEAAAAGAVAEAAEAVDDALAAMDTKPHAPLSSGDPADPRDDRVALAARIEEEARLLRKARALEQKAAEEEARRLAELSDDEKRARDEAERKRVWAEEQRARAEAEAVALAKARALEAKARALAAIDEAEHARADDERRAAEEAARLAAAAEAARVELALVKEEAAAKRQAAEAERVRVMALLDERSRVEAETAQLLEEQRAATELERARLAELEAERARVEAEAAAAARAADEERARETAALEALREARARAEAELSLLLDEQARRRADEDAAIAALRSARAELEGEEAAATAERAARIKAEHERTEALAAERSALVDDEARAAAARAARIAEEAARVAELVAERERLAAEQAREETRVERERAARIAEEEAAVAALVAEQGRLRAEQTRLQAGFAEREELERARLAELEIARVRASADLDAARADVAARVVEEEARLKALSEERARMEAAAAHALDEHRRRVDEEQAKLRELAHTRRALEADTAALAQKTSDDEMLARARLAELEIARLRAEEEAERLLVERHAEAEAARAAVAALEAQRDGISQELDARAAAVRAAADEEEARLGALRAEREAKEAALRDAEAEARARVAAEEERLAALVAALSAQQARAEEEARRVAAVVEDAEAAAQARLAALQAEHARLAAEAVVEAERLARLRAEEEAARRELEESRARQRLAFQTGRFDAVPVGRAVVGDDIGKDARPATDADGVAFGGGFVDVDVDDSRAPPPPLPFVPLEPAEGRFVDGELPQLLLSAHALGVTGAIVLTHDDGRSRTLYLEQGEPVFVASTLTTDRADELLLRGGFITAARHAELRARAPSSARRLCAQLVEDGALKLDELFPAVRGVLTEQLLALCEWASGSFAYGSERAFAADRVRLAHPFAAVVAEGVRRKFDEARLWAVLGGPQTLLGPPSTSAAALALPPLSPEEALALSRFDGTRALDDVILESGLAAHAVLRAALIGVSVGHVLVLARGMPQGPSEAIARRERTVAIDRERVLDKLQLARHGDYFSFLGVDVDATAFEVHRAAQRLRERFDPARYGDAVFADLSMAVKEIVDVAGDAEAVLADDGLRDAYKRNLRATAPRSPSTSTSSLKRLG